MDPHSMTSSQHMTGHTGCSSITLDNKLQEITSWPVLRSYAFVASSAREINITNEWHANADGFADGFRPAAIHSVDSQRRSFDEHFSTKTSGVHPQPLNFVPQSEYCAVLCKAHLLLLSQARPKLTDSPPHSNGPTLSLSVKPTAGRSLDALHGTALHVIGSASPPD
eukprot:6191746-Pleurochrysis_carterae.AAC.1